MLLSKLSPFTSTNNEVKKAWSYTSPPPCAFIHALPSTTNYIATESRNYTLNNLIINSKASLLTDIAHIEIQYSPAQLVKYMLEN
jgi:hypothetical protein